jgi:nicotinamidase-related amidase
MHHPSEILKTLGRVPQECLKQSEIFSVKIHCWSPQAAWPKNNRPRTDTVINKWRKSKERLIYFGKGVEMRALIVVDVQNEFSAPGLRAVPNHGPALDRIHAHVEHARQERWAIAWVRHYNKPHESSAFVPGTWGAEFSPGIGPEAGFGPECIFEKDVYGAFTYTRLEEWLLANGVSDVLLVGFYAHGCVSTTAREALIRGFEVSIDPEATGACDMEHPLLGQQTADEVRRSALLHLTNMGVKLESLKEALQVVTVR